MKKVIISTVLLIGSFSAFGHMGHTHGDCCGKSAKPTKEDIAHQQQHAIESQIVKERKQESNKKKSQNKPAKQAS